MPGNEQNRVERIVAVDWSGRVDAAGQRRHIWAGVWTAAPRPRQAGNGTAKPGDPTAKMGRVTLETGRTRAELIEWLIALARETPRMVVGIDCCFSFPKWFMEEHECLTVFEFWQQVAAGKGEAWLHRDCADIRFWGKRKTRPAEFCGDQNHRMMRQTDMENKVIPRSTNCDPDSWLRSAMRGITAKSPFQIGGSGSVGTGSLRAMPALLHLREAGFRIWPFDDAALEAASPRPLVIEMYTRLLTGAVAKSNAAARKLYLDRRRQEETIYAGLSPQVRAKALASEDGFDALVSALELVRWRNDFASLRRTQNPQLQLEGITWRPGL